MRSLIKAQGIDFIAFNDSENQPSTATTHLDANKTRKLTPNETPRSSAIGGRLAPESVASLA
ncbi:MAG: hypothetical protein WBM71_17200 [Sedimenticolaceae bacterium]|jgi:hypothetical protein